MHRSRLAGFIIDCKDADLDAAAEFWGRALGYDWEKPDGEEGAKYRRLETGPDCLHIEVQNVDHASRVHLDIETDDIEAEAARLEALGARRIGKVSSWLVMEAPTGQRFCLVAPSGANFERDANAW